MSRFSDEECTHFEESAVPHAWLLVAEELHIQAQRLFRALGDNKIIQRDGQGRVLREIDQSNRAAFLLAGFALENLIKGYLVYENPAWISDGRLSRELTRGHSLSKLAAKSNALPWPKRCQPTLLAIENGLSSWARYPCAVHAGFEDTELEFTQELWSRYALVNDRFVLGLETLLEKNWKGSHGFEGYYTFHKRA
ncbi:MAG: hypothetical protein ACJA0Y_001976 [Maricaulis maris]|jgi:hypothetical protein